MPREIIVKSKSDWQKIIPTFLEYLGDRKKIMLYAEMGSGKTTFARAFAQYFKVSENPSSPTFSIINEYTYRDDKGIQHYIYHVDLYRLKKLEEALDINIEDILYDDNYCLIEWAQLIEDILPEDAIKISIEVLDNGYRKIVFLEEAMG